MDFDTLKKLQSTELEILKIFDRFCSDNNLKYSLYAGTALGAIRHKGFIPWDDDVDVCMERTQYERFLDLWEENGINGYFLQSERDFENTRINFSKIRMDGTTFISNDTPSAALHNGIWLDIFAIDKVPKNKLLRKKLLFWAKIRMVYTRGYAYLGGKKVLEVLSRIMLCIPPFLKTKLRAYSCKYISQYKDMTAGYDLMSFSCPEGLRYVYPANAMSSYSRIPFENFEASITTNIALMLKICYGDYMQLPPEEDRICKHQPLEISFGDKN